MPVPLKQAVANALEFAEGLLGNRAADVRLEEVESIDSNGASAWLITLSMNDPPRTDALGSALRRHRDYKTFTVLKDTGDVTAMKIREFADR